MNIALAMKRHFIRILAITLAVISLSASAFAATMGEQNALLTAKSYLTFTAFSYDGLISQLEYEGYSSAEATYAASNCGADWDQQAVLSATNYLSFTAFSKKGLISQLEYEGFTTDQAIYGVEHCNVDWNEQAVKCGQNYLSFTSFSRSGLKDQLAYEGFTSSQVDYAIGILYDGGSSATPTPKPTSIPKPTSTPKTATGGNTATNKTVDTSTADIKTVTVPVGEYIVGEDIPAGSYQLTGSKYAVLRVYENESKTYYDDSFEVEKPDFIVGKVTLKDGMKVQVVYASIDFSTYSQINGIESLTETGSCMIPTGCYIVGEDIPAGVYQLTGSKYGVLRVYENESKTYYDDSFEVEKPDFVVGKVTLETGMKVQVVYASICFSAYSHIDGIESLAAGKPCKIPTGCYIVGEDIPAGSYSMTSDKYAVLRVYKSASSKYYDQSYECEKPDFLVGKVTLKDGMCIQIVYSPMTFDAAKGLGF